MKNTETVGSKPTTKRHARPGSDSATTKPSWMGDYSIGQVSGSLQSSSQKSTTNQTLAAMFGARKTATGGRGGGGGGGRRRLSDAKVKKRHKKNPTTVQSTPAPTSEKKNKNVNRNRKGSDKSGGVAIQQHKSKMAPTGQTKSTPSKHIVFDDDDSSFSRVKSNEMSNKDRKRNTSKQATPDSFTGIRKFHKANSEISHSKHVYFGEDRDSLFPRSVPRMKGRNKAFGAKREQNEQSKHILFGEETPSAKRRFKVKKKRKKGGKGNDPSEMLIGSKEQSASKNGISTESSNPKPAKEGSKPESVPAAQTRDFVGKKNRKRRLSLEKKSKMEVPKKANEKASGKEENHETPSKKKKRRKRKKKSAVNVVKDKQNVESKERTEVLEPIQKDLNGSKNESNNSKKKKKRKRKYQPHQAAKSDELNITNEKPSPESGNKKAKLSPKEAKSGDTPITPKKRRRRSKNKSKQQRDMITSPAKDAEGAKSGVGSVTPTSKPSNPNSGNAAVAKTNMQSKPKDNSGLGQRKGQADRTSRRPHSKSQTHNANTTADAEDESDEEIIKGQPPKKAMLTSKNKQRFAVKKVGQREEESDDNSDSGDENSDSSDDNSESSDDEVTEVQVPKKVMVTDKHKPGVIIKKKDQEKVSDDSSDDEESEVQFPKKVVQTDKLKPRVTVKKCQEEESDDTSDDEVTEVQLPKKVMQTNKNKPGVKIKNDQEEESDGSSDDSSDEVTEVQLPKKVMQTDKNKPGVKIKNVQEEESDDSSNEDSSDDEVTEVQLPKKVMQTDKNKPGSGVKIKTGQEEESDDSSDDSKPVEESDESSDDSSDDEVTEVQLPKKLMRTDKNKPGVKIKNDQEEESAEISDDSSDDSSGDEVTKVQLPKKVTLKDKNKQRVTMKEEEQGEEEESDSSTDTSSSDDEITQAQYPKKVMMTNRGREQTKREMVADDEENDNSSDSSDNSEQLPIKTLPLDSKRTSGKANSSEDDTDSNSSSEDDNIISDKSVEEITSYHNSKDVSSEKKMDRKKEGNMHGGHGRTEVKMQDENDDDDESGDSDDGIQDSDNNSENIEEVLKDYESDLLESATEPMRKTNGNNENLSSYDEDVNTPKNANHDPEVAKRTVFVGNLPTDTAKQELKAFFKKFGQIESVRFRSGARADPKSSQKVAMITKHLHPERSSYNGYVVFQTAESAHDALKKNGKLFGSHHIRVDLVQNSKKHDTKHSVFVGNLPFDMETEPLLKHFMQCGKVEGARLIRDAKTGLGKGFGYVLFKDPSCVELALKLDGSSLLGRAIRVNRALTKEKLKKQDQQKQQKGGASKGGKGQQKRKWLDPKVLQKRQKRRRYKNKLKAKGAAGKM